MELVTYYSQDYSSIIGTGLVVSSTTDHSQLLKEYSYIMGLPVELHTHFPVEYSAANSLTCVAYFYHQST